MRDAEHHQAGRILAHRGLWMTHAEQNTPQAIQLAIQGGFGLELDLRDRNGRLVVSHDPATDTAPLWDEVKPLLAACRGPVALNIKSDGLAQMIKNETESPPEIFVFDMSWPQTVGYVNAGVTVALRASEYEALPRDLFHRLGIPPRIWLDSFHEEWWLEDFDTSQWPGQVSIFVVSPELHGRDPVAAWSWVRANINSGLDVYLCTDYCADALEAIS